MLGRLKPDGAAADSDAVSWQGPAALQLRSRIDAVTSATGTGRSAAGRCRPSRMTWCRPGQRPTVTAPGCSNRPGCCAPPSSSPGRGGGPGRCPASDYSTPGGGPAAVTVPGRRSEPGPVPLGPTPERGPVGRLTVPHVAESMRTAGPPLGPPGDRIAGLHRHRGAGRRAPGRRRWGQCRAGPPDETAKDAVYCEGPENPPGPEPRAAIRAGRWTSFGWLGPRMARGCSRHRCASVAGQRRVRCVRSAAS